MNSDLSFYVRIGLTPVNKAFQLREGDNLISVRSLLLDPWFFELPGFRELFETHIFAPKNIRQTFGGAGVRMLSRYCLKKNLQQFFSTDYDPQLFHMDRRDPVHLPYRLEERFRKTAFLQHFMHDIADETKEVVHLDEIEEDMYEPFSHGFFLSKYIPIREYRYQQFLRYLVGIRFAALKEPEATPDLRFLMKLLENMSLEVKPKKLELTIYQPVPTF